MSVPLVQGVQDEKTSIPDKLYFRIGEVARLVGVEPYVLRYWETEFTKLMPRKSGSGHRLYRRKDVEMVLELKRLLYEKRFTIEGARLALEQSRKKEKEKEKRVEPLAPPVQAPMLFAMPDPQGDSAKMELVRNELRELVALLARA
jgi:DNA-binding transcriptional MerR regulator